MTNKNELETYNKSREAATAIINSLETIDEDSTIIFMGLIIVIATMLQISENSFMCLTEEIQQKRLAFLKAQINFAIDKDKETIK
jgi:hypothetical protein